MVSTCLPAMSFTGVEQDRTARWFDDYRAGAA